MNSVHVSMYAYVDTYMKRMLIPEEKGMSLRGGWRWDTGGGKGEDSTNTVFRYKMLKEFN